MKAVLGTMNIGQQVFGHDAADMLRLYAEHGGHELDTAYVYNDGACESEIGACLHALAEGSFRIATKVNPRISTRLDYDAVIDQCNESLRRLGTASVDILYFHFPDPNTPIGEPLRAAAELYNQGKYTELGVSNFPLSLVEEMAPMCDSIGCPRPTVYEGVYNALSRKAEDELLPALDGLGMRFNAYNPLAGGLLTGKYASFSSKPTEGRFALRAKSYQGRYWKESYFEAVSSLTEACAACAEQMAEASLRWLVHHSMLDDQRGDGIIVGASNLRQLTQNLEALSKGPLPESVATAFRQAWDITRPDAPEYYRYYEKPKEAAS